MGENVILGNASWRPRGGGISYDEGGGDHKHVCIQHHTTSSNAKNQSPIISKSLLKGGDTAGLSLLYTVTGQFKKLKKLARLLSIKGEASQEYRCVC